MYCSFCGKQNRKGAKYCSGCGKPLPKPKHNLPMILLIIVLALILIVGCVFLAFEISGYKLPFGETKNYCVWISENGYQFVKNMNKDNFDVIDIADSDYSDFSVENTYFIKKNFAHITSDGKYLYYFDRFNNDEDPQYGTLYRAELGKLKPNKKSNGDYVTKIDSDVNIRNFYVREDGSVFYCKDSSSDNYTYRLFFYDGSEPVLIDKDISEVKYTSEVVFYNKPQSDDMGYSLYAKKIISNDEPVKIDTNTEYTFSVFDSEHLLYSKESANEDDYGYSSDLYVAGYSAPSTKISSGTYTDYDFSTFEDSGRIFFTKKESVIKKLGNYVTNPYEATDLSAVAPDENAPEYVEEYTDWWWTSTRNNDAYYAAYNEYQQSVSRLEIMTYLNSTEYEDIAESLYYWDINMVDPILISNQVDDNATTHNTAIADNVSCANYFKKTKDFKKMSIDAIMSHEDYQSGDMDSVQSIVEQYIFYHSADTTTLYFTVVGGVEQSVSTESLGIGNNGCYVDMVVFNGGKNIAILGRTISYDDYSRDFGSLNIASVDNCSIGEFAMNNIAGANCIYYANDNLICTSDSEIYIYRNNSFILLHDIYREDETQYITYAWYPDNTIIYLVDYDERYGGTLMKIDPNGEKQKLLDDVTIFSALENGAILYQSNGYLRRYDGNANPIIAGEVGGYWCINEIENDYLFLYSRGIS